jgi:hypothetical protein
MDKFSLNSIHYLLDATQKENFVVTSKVVIRKIAKPKKNEKNENRIKEHACTEIPAIKKLIHQKK